LNDLDYDTRAHSPSRKTLENLEVVPTTMTRQDDAGREVSLTVLVEVRELDGRWTARRSGPDGSIIQRHSQSRTMAVVNCAMGNA
jgi:hypothetical protein